jgi:hypothetical protein
MLASRSALTRRILAALDASPPRIVVLLGGCGSGKTTLLNALSDRLDRRAGHFVDVERTATTPERFYQAVRARSPFVPGDESPLDARSAFAATLSLLGRGHAPNGESAVVMLDEFLELRTFERFPGLRRALGDFLNTLAASSNRFVLTSRYTARSLRLLRDRSGRIEIVQLPPLTAEEALEMLGSVAPAERHDAEFLARTAQALADGRPAYVNAIAEELTARRREGGTGAADVISALTALLTVDGGISLRCRFSYELRLHRARGYGALKAILDILAEEEGLTLTEISRRLQRTPGSAKDYLSWLEDVDLVVAHQKRYSFVDPLLRVWVRLHCRALRPAEEAIAHEVRRYAMPRLPRVAEPALTPAAVGAAESTNHPAWRRFGTD